MFQNPVLGCLEIREQPLIPHLTWRILPRLTTEERGPFKTELLSVNIRIVIAGNSMDSHRLNWGPKIRRHLFHQSLFELATQNRLVPTTLHERTQVSVDVVMHIA